jgi:hypothetical protein
MYTASDMYLHLHTHSDASYSTSQKRIPEAAPVELFSSAPNQTGRPIRHTIDDSNSNSNSNTNTDTNTNTNTTLQRRYTVHTVSSILSNVIASTTVTELATLFHNTRDAIPLRTILMEMEMGHPQATTPHHINTK